MTSILRSLLPSRKESGEDSQEVLIDDDKISQTPYIISSIFYLSVILFVGVPMWFYTCSATRHSLPNLSVLQDKLTSRNSEQPKLHLDISVIHLSRSVQISQGEDLSNDDRLTEYLRKHLSTKLVNSIGDSNYDINWRVRRPTQDENSLFTKHQAKHTFSNDSGLVALVNLEESLLKIHKPPNNFRLFMYLVSEPYYSAYCSPTRSHTYTIGLERFVYLCPSNALVTPDNYSPVINLINNVIEDVYVKSIDVKRVKHIVKGQIDMLVSILPEMWNSGYLTARSRLADKIHHIYDKNVKERFPELKELVNIQLITHTVYDLLDDKLTNILIREPTIKADPNATVQSAREPRIIRFDKIEKLFHSFESRVTKYSSQNVYNVLLIAPDPDKGSIIFQPSQETLRNMSILEGQDSNAMFVANDDKSIVLALRAIVRRLIGLTSANMCENCMVRRDVFLNRWEIDALMGILTTTKLEQSLLSLRSISQQVMGIKISKEVAETAGKAYNFALMAAEHLETKCTLESYRLASKAYDLSESAYYDPSLLESLYFPDDLKYAIYLPLFIPLAAPITLSFIRLLKQLYSFLRQQGCSPKVKIN